MHSPHGSICSSRAVPLDSSVAVAIFIQANTSALHVRSRSLQKHAGIAHLVSLSVGRRGRVGGWASLALAPARPGIQAVVIDHVAFLLFSFTPTVVVLRLLSYANLFVAVFGCVSFTRTLLWGFLSCLSVSDLNSPFISSVIVGRVTEQLKRARKHHRYILDIERVPKSGALSLPQGKAVLSIPYGDSPDCACPSLPLNKKVLIGSSGLRIKKMTSVKTGITLTGKVFAFEMSAHIKRKMRRAKCVPTSNGD